MRLVITGANSFIGKRLAKKAAEQGDELLLIMRPGHKGEKLPLGAQCLFLDFQEYSRLGELAGRCDCFVHLAWNGTRGEQRMDAARQHDNVRYSLEAVRSMLDAGCRRIITAGSQAEYGPHTGQITEESDCHPNTEYGKAKLTFYQEVSALCRCTGAECREPRFFSLYGPDDYKGTMIISTLRNMLRGHPCELTLGLQNWDFLYIEDAVEALYRLCTWNCPDGIYNFGSGDTRQLKDYILEMAQITGTDSELRFGSIPYPPTGMVSLSPNVSKLCRELKWAPKTAFAQGIGHVLEALNETERV